MDLDRAARCRRSASSSSASRPSADLAAVARSRRRRRAGRRAPARRRAGADRPRRPDPPALAARRRPVPGAAARPPRHGVAARLAGHAPVRGRRTACCAGPGCFDMKAGAGDGLPRASPALRDRDGVTLLVTGDEELGSPSSRALIEAEAAGRARRARARGVRRRRRAQDRAQGRLAVRGARCSAAPRTPASSRSGASTRPSSWPTRCSRSPRSATRRSARPSRRRVAAAGTTTNTVPADGSFAVDVRVRDRRRAGAGRRRDARAARRCCPGAALEVTGGPNRPPLEAAASAGAVRARAARSPRGLGLPRRSPAPRSAARRDGNFTAGVGTPTLDGLGAVGGGAHADDEHVLVAELPGRTALLAALLADAPRREPANRADDVWCGTTMTDSGERHSMERVTRPPPSTPARPRGGAPTRPRSAGVVGARAHRPRRARGGRARLFATIWGRDPHNPPVTPELLRAFDQGRQLRRRRLRRRPAGRRVRRLLRTRPAADALHSHIAGVVRGARRPQRRLRAQAAPARLGAAARASPRSRGPSTRWSAATPTSTWPSSAADAGRVPAELLRRRCTTRINGDDDTDRLLVRWRLRDPAVVAACAGGGSGGRDADELAAGARGRARRRRRRRAGAGPPRRRDRRWSPYPATSRRCARADPALAQRWRVAVREALGRAARRRRPGRPASTGPAGTS